ncbi:DUF302 domain-containing protein [Lysobacter olei]
MTFIRRSDHSVEILFQRVQDAAKANGFGVLHTYDFKQILAGKGFDLPQEVRVLEVCNPAQAHEVLGMDVALNMMLPCRISVYEDDGGTAVGMVPPSALLALVSQDPRIQSAAREVEVTMEKIIEQAVAQD